MVTNVRGMRIGEPFDRYRGPWQVEASFRIAKHDLKARPIFHWTPRRVRAHIAIAFMAFARARHLAYRVALRKQRMSPKKTRGALLNRQCSVLRHARTKRRYLIPLSSTPEVKRIYDAMGLKLSDVPP